LPRGPQPQGPSIMIGTTGPRMLRLAAEHADGWNAWFSWYGNTPEGVAELRTQVDQACAAAGRDPATLDRTVAVLVQVGEGELLRRSGRYETPPPLRGSAEELAAELRRFASEGISHVQLVVDPITIESIESLAGMLEALDR
jgi:alkanesulfonate monooxygenase SsuD/methylene tetrahydromethanopterin reductase-like flavin-dependent oxidoreductase (luciferase family)